MPYGIEVINKSEDTAEIEIYGYISDAKWYDDDVTPADFKKAMNKLKNKKRIDVHINSGGGGVWAGMAITNILEKHPADTWGYVDGIAASIASVILQGCKNRVVSTGSLVMIHNPSAVAIGEAEDMRKTADMLDKVKTSIIDKYAGRTTTSAEEISQMMTDETWMTAEEAVTFGFADSIDENKEAKATFNGTIAVINGIEIDPARYRAFPRDMVRNETPAQPPKPPAAEPAKPEPVDYTEYELQVITNNNLKEVL